MLAPQGRVRSPRATGGGTTGGNGGATHRGVRGAHRASGLGRRPRGPAPRAAGTDRGRGEQLAPLLGRPSVIANRAGAQGIVGQQALEQWAPDGHTIAYGNTSDPIINPFAYRKLPYDPMNDLDAVSRLGLAPLGMAVPTASGIRSVERFVQWVRANPGKATFASFGTGSSSHPYGEMLKLHAKLDMVHVPYSRRGA
jgi:tripartite-type tricarboxylate transporter receptor subunit TctC